MHRLAPLLAVLPLLAADEARADERLAGIACRSVHLDYTAPECDVFVNSVTVHLSAPGTYFCVCGFGKGYMGLQQLANDRRVLIFSVWDPGQQNDPNTVEEDRRVKLLHRDPAVRIGRFGNEGTGGQSFLDLDWETGTTYHLAVSAEVRGPRTEYTSWLLDPENDKWRKLVTFSTLAGERAVTGAYAFVEDFRRNRVSTRHARRATFGPAWTRRDGEWHPITEARFTADSNPATNIDAGAVREGWFLATGGGTTNDHAKLRELMPLPEKSTDEPDHVRALGTLLSTDENSKPPYPPSSVIAGLDLDWSTHRRAAPGSDNFQLAWADDDHLYGAWGDGGGFGGTNGEGRVPLGVARIEGSADDHTGHNVWGGHEPENPATFDGKSWGMIGTGGALHMWVVPDRPEGKSYRNHYESIRLATSRDHGATWTRADWRFTQADDLTIPTFLNFGRDNAGVPAEFGNYVYSYFIRPAARELEQEGERGVGLIVHRPGALYLARAKSDALTEGRDRYEFFAGLGEDGSPRWGNIDEKQPVLEDANGVGWCVSACYHPELKRVLLATEHGHSQQGLLGFFDAPTPWGPWTTVAYHTPENRFGAGRPGSTLPWRDNVFFASFPTKWFDGKGFTLAFTGAGRGRDNDSFNTVRGRFRQHANR